MKEKKSSHGSMMRCAVDDESLPSPGLEGFSFYFFDPGSKASREGGHRAATVGVCLPETRRQMRIGTLENCVLGLGYSYSPGERNRLFIRPVRL
jgi:hypothetical protein